MSQLTGVPMALGLDVADFRVEHQFTYRQDSYMTPDMVGYIDDVTTRVVVNSDASQEALEQYSNTSLKACFAAEAFDNETPIETGIYVNGALVDLPNAMI